LAAPKPKPDSPVVGVVARSANEAKFFEAERSTPFEAGDTSSVLEPKLKPENGDGFAGSVGSGFTAGVVSAPNLAKLKVDAVTGAAAGFSGEMVSTGLMVSACLTPKLKPEDGGVAAAAAAGLVSAGLPPKLNPEVTGVELADAAAPKVNPEAGVVGVAIDVPVPNLNPDVGAVVVVAGPRLKPPPLTAGPLLNLKDEAEADVAAELLASSSLPGWTVWHAGHRMVSDSLRQRQPGHSHEPDLGLNCDSWLRSFFTSLPLGFSWNGEVSEY
jgi:hypothetical protein